MSNKSKKGNGNGGDGQSKLAKQRSQVMQMLAKIGPHILPVVFMVDTNTSYARLFCRTPRTTAPSRWFCSIAHSLYSCRL